jgi:hypothetical protein
VTVTNPTIYYEIVQVTVGSTGMQAALAPAVTQTLAVPSCGPLTSKVIQATDVAHQPGAPTTPSPRPAQSVP